ncbi:hypothetical protein [Polaromonas sp.]|uniref:hypothetical protein n=1 Tax=Polaromonas sp. TaxID=1869339 RepID=UPI00352BAE49
MPKFKINFEATAFTDDKEVLDATLEGADALALTDACRADGSLPSGVLAVTGARISEDDGQGDTDIHCFVCVDLEIEGDSLDAVEKFEPPAAFLTRISEFLTGASTFDLEANSWEVVDVSASVEPEEALITEPAPAA